MGNPLHDDYVFPVPSVPTTSRSLLGRVSPFWWEVPTQYSYSISRCVSPAETGSQLRQYPSRSSRTASCASDTQHILRNYTINTFLSNNILYNTTAGQLGCFIGGIHNNFMLHIKHVCSLPEYMSDCHVPPVTAADRHQSSGSHPQRSREVAMTTSDHCLWPISTIHQRPYVQYPNIYT